MGRRVLLRSAVFTAGVLCTAMSVAGCSSSRPTPPPTAVVSTTAGSQSTVTSRPTITSGPTSTPAQRPSHPPLPPTSTASHPRPAPPSSRSVVAEPPTRHPVVVIDPGHSPAINGIDPVTDLTVSNYENEPEMRDVFAVAELVKAQLAAAGYRVIMTRPTVATPVLLNQIAAIANNAHAALALSIHDQAGGNGGIGFDQGNNIVYYQTVGTYRVASNGTRTVFTDRNVAALSQRYGQIFRTERAQAEAHPVRLQGDVGYDLGSRGLNPGNIWMVQLLAHVPWIYNEAGGNSVGQSGLNAADKQRYANGLVASVEACIPL